MGQLHAVGAAHHVVMENYAPHPRELHAAGLKRIAAAERILLCPGPNLLLNVLRAGVVKSSVVPVPVRAEHARQPAAASPGMSEKSFE